MGTSVEALPARELHAKRFGFALQVLSVAVLLAISAPVAIPVPGLPAPITLQTLLVASAGLKVGATRAAMGVTLWILWGVLGAPVLAGAQGGLDILLSLRGSYLLGMPVAAVVCGALRHSPLPRVSIFLLGSLIVLAAGGLGCWIVMDAQAAFELAVLPYLSVEALKGICGHFMDAAATYLGGKGGLFRKRIGKD